jgi:fermentation-respiration switch protein FrsA (DUF1100 family)
VSSHPRGRTLGSRRGGTGLLGLAGRVRAEQHAAADRRDSGGAGVIGTDTGRWRFHRPPLMGVVRSSLPKGPEGYVRGLGQPPLCNAGSVPPGNACQDDGRESPRDSQGRQQPP